MRYAPRKDTYYVNRKYRLMVIYFRGAGLWPALMPASWQCSFEMCYFGGRIGGIASVGWRRGPDQRPGTASTDAATAYAARS